MGQCLGLQPHFPAKGKGPVRGKIMPVREITRNAVPQFLTSSGTVNVSLSTKIAEVAMIREMQMATTDDMIIPK